MGRSLQWLVVPVTLIAATGGCHSWTVVQSGSPARRSFDPDAAAFWSSRSGLVGGFDRSGGCQTRCPGRVEMTGDGGRTWRTVLRTSGPVSVLAAFPGGAFAQTSGGLYRSTDAGRSWRRVGPGVAAVSLSFPDLRHGWAVTRQGALRTTDDGGAHWADLRSPCSSETPSAVALATPQAGWALCGDPPGAGFQFDKRLLRTLDGGGRWQRVRSSLSAGGYIDGLAMGSDGVGLAWYQRAGLDLTVDGGRSWWPVPVINPGLAGAGCDNAGAAQVLTPATFVLLDERCTVDHHTIDLRISTTGGRSWQLAHTWRIP